MLVYLDLLTADKQAMLRRTASGPLALEQLRAVADRLIAINESGAPFAAELGEADRLHDIGCTALNQLCDLFETLSVLPRFVRLGEVAGRVRATLAMERTLTRASYAAEAATASRNREVLPKIVDELAAMHVTDGVSGVDVAEMFISGGEQLRHWLRQRSRVLAEANSARAEAAGTNLLHESREVLKRLRATIEGEVSWRDDLPKDFTAQLFSELDARIAAAAAAARGKAQSGEGEDGAEVAPDADAPDAPDAAPAPEADAPAAPSDDAPPRLSPLPVRRDES